MNTKIFILFLVSLLHFQLCKAQQSQSILPKVENHLNGELDYTHEALDLLQRQVNGEQIILGKIKKDGTIQFNLQEFNIKALYDSIPLQHQDFHQLFKIDSSCKDRDVFADTSFDDVYSQKYKLLVKKYGMNVAILEPASNNNMNSSNYFWFYIDRAISFKEKCSKVNNRTGDIYANINADIQFEKGWNFIEETIEIVNTDSKGDSLVTQLSKIQFTKTSPLNKKVKWSLRQIQEDEKIQTAKRLYNVTPLTKEQFEKWAPNKLSDLRVTTKEHGNTPKGQKNKNNIHLTYTNKTQEREIDLYVVDCAMNPDDLEMINFAYAMQNNDKDEKDMKPYVAKYSEQTKATQLLFKVEDRLFVNASGVNINAEELWDYIKNLNVENLLKK